MRIPAYSIFAKEGVPDAKYEEEEYSSRDEAIEHAKSYWMLGWAWDEIDAILSDMGFNEKDVGAAITEAQKYATEALSNGPFSLFKEGQLIKLSNGAFGTFRAADKENAVVQIDADNIHITAKNIDVEASKKLREAYNLRKAASELISVTAQFRPEEVGLSEEDVPDTITTPLFTELDKQDKPKRPRGRPRKVQEAPQEMQKREPVLPSPVRKEMDVVPEPEETFEFPRTKDKLLPTRAPGEFGELTPKVSDVDEVTELAEEALNQLEALDPIKAAVVKDNAELTTMAREVKGKLKELDEQQVALAKKIFAIISTQTNDLNDLNKTVFYKYKNKIIGLQKKITSEPLPVGVMDELSAVKEFLKLNHPAIAEETEDALAMWKKQNTIIKEQLVNTFAYYPPPREKTSQILTKVKDWFVDTWKSIKSVSSNLYDSLFPAVDEGIALMDALEAGIDAESGRLAIATVMKNRFGCK